MKYLKPRKPSKVGWTISDQTLCIIEQYAKFSSYSEEFIVEEFMKNLLGNPEFTVYLRGLRRNKRMVDRIFYGDEEMSLLKEFSAQGKNSAMEAPSINDIAPNSESPN